MLHEQEFTARDVTQHYVDSHSPGPPLLLLHGVTRCWQTFSSLIPALAQRWRVYGLDHRGHGRSERRHPYRVIDYAADTAAFVEQALATPVVLYGHSLGAMAAAAVAAELPQLVRAVVLEDPPFDTMGARIRETPWHSYFTGIAHLAGSERPVREIAEELADVQMRGPTGQPVRLGDVRDASALRFTAACLRRLDPDVLPPIVAGRWLEEYDRDGIFGRVRCPVLLVQADPQAGGALIDSDAEAVADRAADCTRVRLSGVGHTVHWQQTNTLLRHALSFLESVEV